MQRKLKVVREDNTRVNIPNVVGGTHDSRLIKPLNVNHAFIYWKANNELTRINNFVRANILRSDRFLETLRLRNDSIVHGHR